VAVTIARSAVTVELAVVAVAVPVPVAGPMPARALGGLRSGRAAGPGMANKILPGILPHAEFLARSKAAFDDTYAAALRILAERRGGAR
jgi:hypothetical protein